MIIKRVVYAIVKVHTLSDMCGEIKEEDNIISVVRIIGRRDGIDVNMVYSIDNLNTFIKDCCEDNDILREVRQIVDNAIDIDEKEVDYIWQKKNIEKFEFLSLIEKSQFTRIYTFECSKDKIMEFKSGKYIYNQIDGAKRENPNLLIHRSSLEPIYLQDEIKHKTNYKMNDGKKKIIYYKLTARQMLDIWGQVLHGFMEKNMKINQSWLSDKDVKRNFSPLINLYLKYPIEYIDLDGNKNGDLKKIIVGGEICDYIGYGDNIILGDNIIGENGIFAIDFMCERRAYKEENMVCLDERLSEFSIDIKNGMIKGKLAYRRKKEEIEKNICMTIDEFLTSIVSGGDSVKIQTNNISEIILQV